MVRSKYLTVILLHLIILSFVSAAPTANTTTNSTVNGQPPERYELCQSPEEIQALQHQYNLTLVSSTPTKAAYMPGWPSALFGVVLCIVTIVTAGSSGDSADNNAQTPPSESGLKALWSTLKAGWTTFHLLFTLLLGIAWIYTFARIEIEKAEGGWLSILGGFNLLFFLAGQAFAGSNRDMTRFQSVLIYILMPFVVLEVASSLAVIIQRWNGTVGSIAYEITDLNGCIPFNGTSYLEKGARSTAFKIIQSVEVVFVDLSFSLAFRMADSDQDGALVMSWAALLIVLYVPEITYEAIIARKGTPVVISGDCMLVELNPRWGFIDSDIENWWKAAELITGL